MATSLDELEKFIAELKEYNISDEEIYSVKYDLIPAIVNVVSNKIHSFKKSQDTIDCRPLANNIDDISQNEPDYKLLIKQLHNS